MAGEAFNVGDDGENYRIREIAEIVARTFPGCALTVGSSGGDTRSYRVTFAKIREHMPEFRAAWTAERGARQLRSVFERIGLTHEMFEAEPFTRLKELKHLREHRPDRRPPATGRRPSRSDSGRGAPRPEPPAGFWGLPRVARRTSHA